MTESEIVAYGALVVNVSAIIWGASKLSSTVTQLQETVREIKTIVMSTSDIVHNLVGRVWVLEDRSDIPHRRIGDHMGNLD